MEKVCYSYFAVYSYFVVEYLSYSRPFGFGKQSWTASLLSFCDCLLTKKMHVPSIDGLKKMPYGSSIIFFTNDCWKFTVFEGYAISRRHRKNLQL